MIIVDSEWSGVDPSKHSVLSIGALDFYNPSNQFYGECKIWNGASISEEALEVNGFTKEQCMDSHKMSEGELVREFIRWGEQCKNHTFAGQNVGIDLTFLRTAAFRAKLNWPFAQRVIDLHTLAYFHMLRRGIKPPEEKNRSALNSDAISAYVGIPNELDPHNALNGAKQAAECFSRLIHDKHLLEEFKEHPIPWVN
jgi:DNA polymerase III subunit epsilon